MAGFPIPVRPTEEHRGGPHLLRGLFWKSTSEEEGLRRVQMTATGGKGRNRGG